MKIFVGKIPEGGRTFQFEKNGEWFRQNVAGSEPVDFTPERIDVACAVSRMRENVFIEGTIGTVAEVSCCRCLETIRLPIRASFKYTFVPPPARLRDEVELNTADLDFAYYEGDTIDLDTVVLEQILLQMPIKPLCSEACRGLCPRCGVNLNASSCKCRDEVLDERLAALKQFKGKP